MNKRVLAGIVIIVVTAVTVVFAAGLDELGTCLFLQLFVGNSDEYKWSSYNEYISKRKSILTDKSFTHKGTVLLCGDFIVEKLQNRNSLAQ